MMKKLSKILILLCFGGFIYVGLELLWRGYSHWSMWCLGAICFYCIGLINEVIPWEMPLWKQSVIGAVIIIVLEFFTGCIVNLWLGWNVWDYSNLQFNILGQVSLLFSVIWIFIATAAIILDDYLRYWIFHEEKPHYRLL